MESELFIEGEPAVFMGRGDREWRERVHQASRGFNLGSECGLRLRFTVSSWRRGGSCFDLDNLTLPVREALGWSDIPFVDTAVEKGRRAGVLVASAREHAQVTPQIWMAEPIIGSVSHTEVHPALAEQLRFGGDGPLRVHLVIHDAGLSVCDFGFEGCVKPTLDRLWPIIGGRPGHPHDHRIHHLIVSRSAARPSGVSIGIEAMTVPHILPPLPPVPAVSFEADEPGVEIVTTREQLQSLVQEGRGHLYNDFGGQIPRYCPIHEVGCLGVRQMLKVAPGRLSVRKVWAERRAPLLSWLQRKRKIFADCACPR